MTADTEWVHRVSEACEADEIRSLVASLAVEPLPVHGEVTVALRDCQLRGAPAAHRDAYDRGAEVQAATHQPGRGAAQVQPDVLRAGGAGGAPQGAAYPQHRRRRLTHLPISADPASVEESTRSYPQISTQPGVASGPDCRTVSA